MSYLKMLLKPEEALVIMAYAGFKYVVERQEQQHIAFMGTRDRGLDVLIKKDDPVYDTSRNTIYNRMLYKIRSKRGVGGLVNLAPRFERENLQDFPGPGYYKIEFKRPQKTIPKYPFGVKLSRFKPEVSDVPGPGMYTINTLHRQIKMKGSFGGHQEVLPPVEIKCVPCNEDVCELCMRICTGDYWQLNHFEFICLHCMRTERKKKKWLQRKKLDFFRRIRTCSFMHDHQGTTAAIRLLTNGEIKTKLAKEDYLDLYTDPYD